MCKEVSFYNVTILTFDALISKAKLRQTLDAMWIYYILCKWWSEYFCILSCYSGIMFSFIDKMGVVIEIKKTINRRILTISLIY